ncbi:MAG: DUF1127 domain-containing protein [Aestuariivirga sp.]
MPINRMHVAAFSTLRSNTRWSPPSPPPNKPKGAGYLAGLEFSEEYFMPKSKVKSSFLQTNRSLFQMISGTFIDAGTCVRTRMELHALDDRALEDIGISLSDIDQIASRRNR